MADGLHADDIRKEFEKQIGDMRKELTRLAESVSERGGDISEEAGEADNGATRRARSAAHQVRKQALVVSDAIKRNPGTAATVLSSTGIVGFLIGVCVGHLLSGNFRHR